MITVTKDMLIGELLELDSSIAYVLMGSGMHCIGCGSSEMESLEEAAFVHGIDCDKLVRKINEYIEYKEEMEAAEAEMAKKEG